MPPFTDKDTTDSEGEDSNNSDNDNENSDNNESDEQHNQEGEETVTSGDVCNEDNDIEIKVETFDFCPDFETENNNFNNKNRWTRNNKNARGNNNSNWRGKNNRNVNNNSYGNNNNKKGSNWNNNNNNNNQGNNNNNQGNKNKNNGNKNNNNNNNNNGKNKNKKVDEINELWTKIRRYVFGKYSYHPLNSWILQLHYRVSFIFFLIVWYITVKYNWFAKEEITCISGHNADTPVEYFVKNICLSYSYIEVDEGKRKYILFYRWVCYIFSTLSILFYAPRCLMKLSVNPRFLGFAKEIQQASIRISADGSDSIIERTVLYFERNLATHKNIYYLFVFIHIFCVFLSCGTFLFLDFVMQGEFWTLSLTYPFSRDPRTFKDRLSETFPPFVQCVIKPQMNMRNKNIDEFYCHLLFNELYEKLFVFLWILLVFQILVGGIYVSLIFLMSFTPFGKVLFWTHLGLPKLKESRKAIFNTLDIGDEYCLYLIKQLVSEVQFCRILEGLEVVLQKHANLFEGKLKSEKNVNLNGIFSEATVSSTPITTNRKNDDYKICRHRTISIGDIIT